MPMRYALTLATAASVEPVTTAELKTHLRIDGTSEDAYIAEIGVAARRDCENFTGRSFVTATWNLNFDDFPDGTEIEVPRAPLAGVTHVKYYDTAGTQQTLAATNYHVDTRRTPGRIVLVDGAAWPQVQTQRPSAVEVQFTAGYGGSAAAVPETFKAAIKLMTAHLFEHRGDGVAGAPVEPPPAIQHLLMPERAFV